MRELAHRYGWSETSLRQWLRGPTTYLGGSAPADVIDGEPDRVVEVARLDWSIEW